MFLKGQSLGLYFFSIYIYAGDIQLHKSFQPQDRQPAIANVNTDLNAIYAFARQHKLHINALKFELILFEKAKSCGEIVEVVYLKVRSRCYA